MSDSPSIAEQGIDLQSRTEVIRDREIELVTGRVLLHAPGSDGRSLCGCDREQLTPIGQPWNAGYLPHLPRCHACAQLADPAGPGQPGQDSELPAPASGVDIRTAHGTAGEHAARDALRAVLGEHDLRRWMFTDLVIIDETIRGGFSHPLTLSPARLVQRPGLALTTFLHEQLHWLEGPATEAAAAEASRRWPDPPPFPGGAADARSTWLHMSICALEYVSLREILGPSAAISELRLHTGYTWIYGQVLAAPRWFTGFLQRHGLQVPRQPPVPRRYLGEAWWAAPGDRRSLFFGQ